MRALASAICAGILGIVLAVPALSGAQDAAVVPPTSGEEPPPAELEPEPTEPPAQQTPPEPAPEPEGGTVVTSDETQGAAPRLVAKGAGSVSMIDFAFSPATVTIGVGETVTWTNGGQEDHTATGSGFATGTVSPGGSASHTFTSAGTFAYVCDFHPNMKGTVEVVGDEGGVPGGPTTEDEGPGGPAPGSEAAAGTLPDAAGSASGLPATGETDAPLIVLGLGLVGCGALAAALARARERERPF